MGAYFSVDDGGMGYLGEKGKGRGKEGVIFGKGKGVEMGFCYPLS